MFEMEPHAEHLIKSSIDCYVFYFLQFIRWITVSWMTDFTSKNTMVYIYDIKFAKNEFYGAIQEFWFNLALNVIKTKPF